jgi:hypothetical protein
MGRGANAAAPSPQVTAVGLLGVADPTILPLVATMLTVYVPAEVGVASTANDPVSGAGVGEEAGMSVGLAEASATGEAEGDAPALAGGEARAAGPLPPHATTRNATASRNVGSFTGGIMNVNAVLRAGLRFRYDPASEAGPDPHPQGIARRGTV